MQSQSPWLKLDKFAWVQPEVIRRPQSLQPLSHASNVTDLERRSGEKGWVEAHLLYTFQL